MCAVKFCHIGDSIDNIVQYDIEEDSYNPKVGIKGMTKEKFE